ncbi:hypothetical protein AAII07_48245 [Microvirga sp. 0TCS3.31]
MPRYYIDLRGHFGTTEDPSGIDLPNTGAAHVQASMAAERLLGSWTGEFPKYYDEIVVEVLNEQLRPILIIPLSDFAKEMEPSSQS